MDPEYTPEASAEHVQGAVVLQLVVNEEGRTTDIAVISPLGFGLDERARAAVEKWKFAPGMKDGKPVKILAVAEFKFESFGPWFDEKADRQRRSFNVALQVLKRSDSSAQGVEGAVHAMQNLSRQRFPPAMHMVGVWETTGVHVTKDTVDGLALIQKAAAENYAPALYEIATRQIEGRDLPNDPETGLETMRRASRLGSRQAQLYLGNRYETGTGVPRQLDQALGYFRLCAAWGVPVCQHRLGKLLLEAPGRGVYDHAQAVAWLQLAGEQGIAEARATASSEAAKLTPAQAKWMSTVKGQLARR